MSWTIGNKEVQSLHIGNKEVQSIVRVSDSKVLYEKPVSYSISLVADKYIASTGETVTFTATVTNGSGSPVVGETVTFKEGANVLGTGVTNASGICSVSYSWNYTNLLYIQAIYDSIESNSVSVTIEEPTKIDTQFYVNYGDYYLKDINGNPLSGKTVHYTSFMGSGDVITTQNGQVPLDLPPLTLTFDGDSEYNGCSYP